MNILEQIVDRIRRELADEMDRFPVDETIKAAETAPPSMDFAAAFRHPEQIRVIAELKKASPSKGLIRPDFQPEELCLELEEAGAAALSVLTEKNYFLGAQEYLSSVKARVAIPVLRKDFIFDPYQVYRARVLGADAILLIAAMLDARTFDALHRLARRLGMRVLCEVHDADELAMVLDNGAEIVGVNSRNLKNFKTSLDLTMELMQKIPADKIRIAESGINTPDDLRQLLRAGASGFLIGEALMREARPGCKLSELIQKGREQ